MSDKLNRLKKFSHTLSKWFSWVAGVALVGMLALTIADIIGVKFFNAPVPGAIEIVGFLGIVVTAFSIALTQTLRGHIQVEFFVIKLPERLQAAISVIVSILAIGLFVVLSWQSFRYGYVLQSTGEVSMTQRIPFYPFVYAIAVSCIPVCLLFLVEIVQSVKKVVNK